MLFLQLDNLLVHGDVHTEDTLIPFLDNRPQYVLVSCNENIRLFREDNLSTGGHDHTSGISPLAVGGDSSL